MYENSYPLPPHVPPLFHGSEPCAGTLFLPVERLQLEGGKLQSEGHHLLDENYGC